MTRSLRDMALAALVLACALSAGLNLFLGSRALHDYEVESALRLDPAGLKTYSKERKEARGDDPVILFFGDSRAFMWPAPVVPTGYRIVNRGISWQTTAQMLLRLEPDALALHPATVVLEAGVNDLKAIANFPERRAEIVADCEGNLDRMVERCLETGARVVVVTVFDIGDVALWRRPFWSGEVASAVHEVNAFLRTLVRPNVVLFDANPLLEDSRGEIERPYQLDYLHLSAAGYAALNGRLGPLLLAPPR